MSRPLAMRLVATSFRVLCAAPDDPTLATRHDLDMTGDEFTFYLRLTAKQII